MDCGRKIIEKFAPVLQRRRSSSTVSTWAKEEARNERIRIHGDCHFDWIGYWTGQGGHSLAVTARLVTVNG